MGLRLLSFHELALQKGINYSRDHLRRLVKDGKFPCPIQLSSARIAWNEAEVDAWVEVRAAARTQSEVNKDFISPLC